MVLRSPQTHTLQCGHNSSATLQDWKVASASSGQKAGCVLRSSDCCKARVAPQQHVAAADRHWLGNGNRRRCHFSSTLTAACDSKGCTGELSVLCCQAGPPNLTVRSTEWQLRAWLSQGSPLELAAHGRVADARHATLAAQDDGHLLRQVREGGSGRGNPVLAIHAEFSQLSWEAPRRFAAWSSSGVPAG